MIKDFLFKLRILASMIYFTFPAWKRDVWDVDLDTYFCCDGHMCGCYATTFRDQLTYYHFPKESK